MIKVFSFLLFLLLAADAKIVQRGSHIEDLRNFEYITAQGEKVELFNSTKYVVVTFEKSTGKIVDAFLKKQPKTYLQRHNIVYIADISSVPSFLKKIIIFPKFKKHSYRTYLNTDERFKEFIAHKKGSITLLRFKRSLLQDIVFVRNVKELFLEIDK